MWSFYRYCLIKDGLLIFFFSIFDKTFTISIQNSRSKFDKKQIKRRPYIIWSKYYWSMMQLKIVLVSRLVSKDLEILVIIFLNIFIFFFKKKKNQNQLPKSNFFISCFLQMGWISSLVLNHMQENWWIFFNLWYLADTILQKSWYHTTKTVTLTTINMYLVLKLYPFVKITWFVCQSDLLDR